MAHNVYGLLPAVKVGTFRLTASRVAWAKREPYNKFIFIYGRGQRSAGWQKADVSGSGFSR
jgi:hypothetical protein